jgi:hypothetical protein
MWRREDIETRAAKQRSDERGLAADGDLRLFSLETEIAAVVVR